MQGLDGLFAARGYTRRFADVQHKYLVETCADAVGSTVCVFCVSDEPKLNVHSVKECLAYMDEVGSVHAIIVYVDTVTPVVRKLIANSSVRMELFRKKELAYNIMNHELVPRHRLASESEKKALERYTPNIPHMRATDAVARFMGFEAGDLVRIDRRDGAVAFRIVV